MRALSALVLLTSLTACSRLRGASSEHATAVVRDASGADLGTLTITETSVGLVITGRLHGLTTGAHGIHLHSVGRCEPPFDTAGPHWNPAGRQHGLENPAGPHMGDMANISVGADGTADVNATTPGGTLRGANPLLDADGASVVVHQRGDDNRTNPAGNSGARIACGVIQER